ncbi:hypothetical protein ACFIJ5_12695 [Haloimpatiens sp. FM7330]|uniref:hypothetical protein n=1 Tax=Haloimpatiens sp. FM7330 TaxID=3298610 RepID=UPI0036342F0D
MSLKHKKIYFSLIIMLFTVCICKNVYAKGINLQVNTGFDGKSKLENVNPVEVIVQATEEDINGTIRVIIGKDKYEHKVIVTKGTEKKFKFSIPIKEVNKSLKVQLIQEKKVLTEKQVQIKLYDKKTVFVGILSENAQAYNYIANIKLDNLLQGRKVEIINLNNEDYTLESMQSLNFIIVDNFNSESLSKNQEQFISTWVNLGGILLIGADKYKYKNYTGMFKSIKDKKYIGKGVVTPLNFDLSEKQNLNKLEQCIEKSFTQESLNKLLNGISVKKQAVNAEKLKTSAHEMLNINLNKAYLLISVIILYLAVLVVLIILKRTKIYMWLITVVSFCIIFFIISTIGGINKPRLAEASIDDYTNNFYKTSLINVYPYKRNIDINLKDTIFMSEQGTGKHYLDPIKNNIVYVPDNNVNYLYNVQASQCENMTNSMTVESGHIKGIIKNKLPYKLKNSVLIVGDTVLKIGDLDVSEEAKLDYKLDHNLKNLGDYEYISSINRCSSMNNVQKNIFEYYYLSENSHYNCKLIGFCKSNEKINVNDHDQKVKQISLEVLPVKLNNKKGINQLPSDFIKPIVQVDESKYSEAKREYTFDENEEIEVHYIIPKEIKPEEIKINTKSDGDNFVIEEYDYSNKKWNKLNDMKINDMKINDINSCIKNGILTLKLKANGRVIIPQICVKGSLIN